MNRIQIYAGRKSFLNALYQDENNAGKVFKTPSKLLDSQRIITTPEATEEKIIVVRPGKNLDKKLAELPNHQVNVKVKTDDADEWNKKPRFSMPKRTERECIGIFLKKMKSPPTEILITTWQNLLFGIASDTSGNNEFPVVYCSLQEKLLFSQKIETSAYHLKFHYLV